MTESQKAFEENYKDFYDLPYTELLKNSKGDYANNSHYVEFKKWQAAEAYGRKQALEGLITAFVKFENNEVAQLVLVKELIK